MNLDNLNKKYILPLYLNHTSLSNYDDASMFTYGTDDK
jgi:hypothetical protein